MKKYIGFSIVIILFFGIISKYSTAKADTISSHGQGLYEYNDVEIGGRQYSYIIYYEDSNKEVSLISLKSKEEILLIPAQIGDMKVINLGLRNPVDRDGHYIKVDELKGEGNKDSLSAQDNFAPWQDSIDSEVKEIVIQEGIEHIWRYAFWNCRIKQLRVASTVKDIGKENGLFYCNHGYRNIKKLVLKGKATNIASGMFMSCGLESVVWPKDYHGKIGDSAFCNNKKLKEIRWPAYKGKNIKKCMGEKVFQYCEALQKVTFPQNMKHIYIPVNSFYYCRKLLKLNFPASTKAVTYSFQTYADNHKVGVRILQFNGRNTKLNGGDYYDFYTLKKKKQKLLTVSKVIAPQNAVVIKNINKMKKIKWAEKSIFEKSRTSGTDNFTKDYAEKNNEFKLAKVTYSYLKNSDKKR